MQGGEAEAAHPRAQHARGAPVRGARDPRRRVGLPHQGKRVARSSSRALRKVAAGGAYITPEVAEQLALGAMPAADAPPHTTLSDREFQVLRMLASGQVGVRHRGAAQPVGQDGQHAQGPPDAEAGRVATRARCSATRCSTGWSTTSSRVPAGVGAFLPPARGDSALSNRAAPIGAISGEPMARGMARPAHSGAMPSAAPPFRVPRRRLGPRARSAARDRRAGGRRSRWSARRRTSTGRSRGITARGPRCRARLPAARRRRARRARALPELPGTDRHRDHQPSDDAHRKARAWRPARRQFLDKSSEFLRIARSSATRAPSA